MFENYKIFFDYDGVLLNSEKLIVKYQQESNQSWNEFFDNLDWLTIYQEAAEINNSFEILRELQERHSNLYVLTKIHSLVEAKVKIKLLRGKRINIPIFTVPPHLKKSDIYLPDSLSILIDDDKKNVDDWCLHGGKGILFDDSAAKDTEGKVKSLHFLLN